MRLFIALPIPKAVKQQLAELREPIRGVRWQDRKQMHLTLKFIGETDRERVGELQANLERIQQPSFSITLEGFGYFPQQGHPKVLWAGIEENRTLLKVQKVIENRCSSLGYETESRPFHPHITIGRLKNVSKRDIRTFINEYQQFRISEVPINEFVLYESKLGSEGAVYERVNTYKLTGSA